MTFIVFFFAFAVIIILVLLGSYFSRLAKWTSAFDAIGKRFRGSVSPATIISRPSMRLWYGQVMAHLRYRRRNTGKCTEFQIAWPDRKIKLEVCSKGVPRRLWRSSKLEDIVLDEPKFHERFDVRGNELDRCQEVFSAGVLWQIDQIALLFGTDEIYISISNGHLLVSKQGIQRKSQHIEMFLQLSLELFDQMMLTRSEGIDFVEDAIATLADDITCPICSDIIREDMVVCVRCKTPHCKDCWNYNSECATFACGSTRFYSPSS